MQSAMAKSGSEIAIAMMKITTSLLVTGLLVGVFTVSGCEGRSRMYDAQYWHENFVTNLQGEVGLKHARQRGPEWDKYLMERVSLPNGNMVYKYDRGGTCRDILEVDPRTDVIVAVRWEGDPRHCIVVP